MNSETNTEYAQRRANETGRRYFVTSYGHALFYCRENLAWVKFEGMTIAGIYKPQS